MANHKSSEKRARQTPKKTARNARVKGSVKTFEKKLMKAIETKAADLKDSLSAYTSQVMKAVSKGVLKKKTAARKVSRIAKKASAKK